VDNASNEDGFVIQRAVKVVFQSLATIGADVTTYVDNTAQPATTFGYRVYAFNALGNSLFSNTTTVVVPAAPAAPTNLILTLLNPPRISLTFRDNANNETALWLSGQQMV
jgi:hypothetical protein